MKQNTGMGCCLFDLKKVSQPNFGYHRVIGQFCQRWGSHRTWASFFSVPSGKQTGLGLEGLSVGFPGS